ncbi:hypothetical protein IV500_18165 [Paeniglutamicibacter antarcticus]|uniref:Uncharacterized protein n=1 Tax=Arthrobacter terrae TaxID=2935737 RepID=A0A931CUP8_9MICC|nr:hypothetical protein [Arthrobacter terrae]
MAWTQMVAFNGHESQAPCTEELRVELFGIGGKITRSARRMTTHLSPAPETTLLI